MVLLVWRSSGRQLWERFFRGKLQWQSVDQTYLLHLLNNLYVINVGGDSI